MSITFLPRALCALALLVGWPAAMAGPGHDHGDEAPTQAAGVTAPRFVASSDVFELVGVVNGQHVTLYLDRYADNTPVKDARLELEVGGKKLAAKPRSEGEFEVELPQPLKPGVTPLTAMIAASGQTDLVAGQIEIAQATAPQRPGVHWQDFYAWAAIGLALLLFAGWWLRRLLARRSDRAGSNA